MPYERPNVVARQVRQHSTGRARHLGLLKPRKVPNVMDRSTPSPQIPVLREADLLALFARYGVGDLVGVAGTEDRIVQLSPRSELACPLHHLTLRPDCCRSCRFLAGEVPATSLG
jgi:hypothetical protein